MCENIFCKPQTLFQAFIQKPIQNTLAAFPPSSNQWEWFGLLVEKWLLTSLSHVLKCYFVLGFYNSF